MRGAPIHGPIRDDSPCRFCEKPERNNVCHDTCEKHAKWKAEVEKVNNCRREYMRKRDIHRH